MLQGVQQETPIAVKIVMVDGRPHFCKVYAYVPPREIDMTWRPNPRAYHGPYAQEFDGDGSILNYARTKADNEN